MTPRLTMNDAPNCGIRDLELPSESRQLSVAGRIRPSDLNYIGFGKFRAAILRAALGCSRNTKNAMGMFRIFRSREVLQVFQSWISFHAVFVIDFFSKWTGAKKRSGYQGMNRASLALSIRTKSNGWVASRASSDAVPQYTVSGSQTSARTRIGKGDNRSTLAYSKAGSYGRKCHSVFAQRTHYWDCLWGQFGSANRSSHMSQVTDFVNAFILRDWLPAFAHGGIIP